MKTIGWMRVVVIGLGLTAAGAAVNAEDVAVPAPGATNEAVVVAGKPQTTCPVMPGNPINKNIFTDYHGKRVYFCCGGCPKQFAVDPEKYMKRMREEGITLEDAPEKAPDASAPDEPALP